jgi:hypothetical protein
LSHPAGLEGGASGAGESSVKFSKYLGHLRRLINKTIAIHLIGIDLQYRVAKHRDDAVASVLLDPGHDHHHLVITGRVPRLDQAL